MDIAKPRPTRGRVPAALAVLTAGLLAFHRAVPNTPGRVGSLLESFLPWLGLAAVPLFLYGLVRRSPVILVAVLLPVAVWTRHFGDLLLPADPAGPRDLVVVQHNVSDENPDPADTARALAGSGADLIALEELVPDALPSYERVLAARYPHHVVRGTVGLWSRYPLSGARTADIKPAGLTEPWSRGLRAVAATPHGEVAVYVAHLPSVRIGPRGMTSARRDESAGRLGREVAAEPLERVVLLGDLNGTVDDRGLEPLTSRLEVPRRGFAFSFPAGLPLVRIDQVMARSATVRGIDTLPATGSDHLPVRARIGLG
ncbi:MULTISPECIES: endonuclease/exonuclease/phosphatase family protein [Streptomyces]|uniref:endonuclease/exonuclease/phosphatase family protein n=1 Tax=Streptomyces TaxID=1883 RepID=UPI0013207755|nr:endonuclease/exonuclease/phosphatase family protein [Streptomyces sp. Z38]